MDDIKKGLNSIKSKIEDKAEGICRFLDFSLKSNLDVLNRLEDEIDAIEDAPAPLYSTGKQVAVGITAGTVTGAIAGRVSKGAAIVIGSALVGFSLGKFSAL